MLAKLKADKKARGGQVSDDEDEEVKQKKERGFDKVEDGIKIVESLYTEDRQPGVAKTCFSTISKVIQNILKAPEEEKFRTLNMENAAIQTKITKLSGGIKIMKGLGFVVKEDA